MDTVKSTSPRGFLRWRKRKKKALLVFQITLRINQECLNVEVATGCMWLIFPCTSEERVGRYLVLRRHVLTSWWCSCHSEFTSLALSVFQINTWPAFSKLGRRNIRQWCRFFILYQDMHGKLFIFPPLFRQKLVFAVTDFIFFHSHYS